MGKIVKSSEYKQKVDLKTKVDFEERGRFFEVSEPSGVISKDVLDAQGKARGILEEAREEAKKIKADAREILNQVNEEMERSRQEGDQRGYQEGLARALDYLNQMYSLRERMFADIEPQVVKLSFSIAEKILGQQIKENDMAILAIVKQALDEAIGSKILVRLNPVDYEKIKAQEKELLAKVEHGRSLSFKEDDSVKVGGCVVESEIGAIDAQLDTQLNAIKKALGL